MTKAKISKRDRERLRETTLMELSVQLIELANVLQRDLKRTDAVPTPGSEGEVNVATRRHYMSFTRARLRAIVDELAHVETCSACLRDDLCPTSVK